MNEDKGITIATVTLAGMLRCCEEAIENGVNPEEPIRFTAGTHLLSISNVQIYNRQNLETGNNRLILRIDFLPVGVGKFNSVTPPSV